MKTVFRSALLIAIVAMAFTGFSAPAKAAAKVQIKVWFVTDTTGFGDDIAKAFNAANPDIEAVVESRATDAHKEALRTVINTDAAPDVYFMWGGIGLMGYYVNAGGAEPLQAYYDKYGWAKRFAPAPLASSTFNSKLYGMPFRIRTMGLFYNKESYKKAGIDKDPQTYAELTIANDKLVKAGIVPLAMGGKNDWMTMRLVDSLLELRCGAAKHDALTEMKLDWTKETCAADAFKELRTWVDKGWLAKNFMGIAAEETHPLVYKGDHAAMYEGDWVVPGLIDEGSSQDAIGFFHFPADTKRISFFGEMLSITSNSKHKDEAAKFLDFVSSPEFQKQSVGKWGGLQPTVDVVVPADAGPLVTHVNQLFNAASGIYLPGDQALPLDVTTVYWKVTDDIVAGVIKPEEAVTKIQAAVDQYNKAKK